MTVLNIRSFQGKALEGCRRVNADRSIGRYVAHLGLVLVLGLTAIQQGAAQEPPQVDLSRMDLEDLMNVKVTSVSKREQSLSRAAAAVFVINREDIRRSGATNIPDLLRMAPGVDVQQIDANAWAISIRGFNSRYSNMVLVLIDGRTVYSPAFSGVFWEHIDVPLEDIDRIEVIRGPGATVWGANAVNGVISIFTKSSKDTKGALVTAGGGSQLHTLDLTQYGGTAGKDGTYRAFGKYFSEGNAAMPDGSPAADHWMRAHGGFRSDWDLSDRDSLMVEGDLFVNEERQMRWGGFISSPFDHYSTQTMDATGGDVLARWEHTLAGGSQTSFQTYFDTYRRTDMGIPEKLRTFDLDFQYHIAAGDRHDIVWGLGYRVSNSALSPGYAVSFTPPSRTDNLYSGFLQDEFRASNSLWLTIGAKLEHNAYTGLEIEPSVRRGGKPPGSRHIVWAAASKAIRQPARSDSDFQIELESIPLNAYAVEVLRMVGNPHVQDIQIRDYELGYRSEIAKTLSLDATAYLSFYHHVETLEPQPTVIIPGLPLQLEIPMLIENKAHAMDYGGELSLNWQATPRWRIRPGYSYLDANFRKDPSSNGIILYAYAGFPQNMFEMRSSLNLFRGMEFDQSLYYTARIPNAGIPGHARLDLRLARRLGDKTEISLVGQNLLRPRFMEFGDSGGVVGTQSVRSVYAQISRRF